MKKNKILILSVLAATLPSVFPFLEVEAQTQWGGTALTRELWLKADDPQATVPGHQANFYTWEDRSGQAPARNFVQNTHPTVSNNAVPRFIYNGMNFNPTVSFHQNGTMGENNGRKLVSAANFPVATTKSYYTFWVSQTEGTVAQTVFAFSANGTNGTTAQNDNNGWFTNTRLQMANAGTAGNHQGLTPLKNYGIGTAIRPNITGTTNQRPQLYHDGVANTGTAFAAAAMYTALPARAVIGNSNLEAVSPFFGTVSEIIVLSAPTNNTLMSDGDLAKVHSYLAIKYGINLQGGNYVLSNGATVFDRSLSTNSGYIKNIFGIARDDANGLLVKQSQSLEDVSVTLFLGSLTTLNSQNTSTELMSGTNGAYMMLGSNGQVENTDYTGGAFSNGNATFSYRSKKILKVQTNMSATPVNLKVDGNYQYVIVSTTESFTPGANTRIYPLNDGIATGITLGDGNFVAFGGYKATPGGIALNMELWLKADQAQSSLPADRMDLVSWIDQSGKGRNFVQNAPQTVPLYAYDGMNFNPALRFEAGDANRKLVSAANFPVEAAKSYYSFWVSQNDGTTGTVFSFLGTTATTYDGWLNNTQLRIGTAASYTDHPVLTPSKNYGIGVAVRPNASSNNRQTVYHNGVSYTATANTTVMTNISTERAVIGNSNLTNGLPFYGDVSEIIVLTTSPNGTAISATDLARVQSYLAIKYGVTLQGGNYVLSDGVTTAFDRTTPGLNTGYLNNIFGIARDDASDLYVKQSRSLEDRTVTLFLGATLAGLNSQNTSSFSDDKKFIMLGSNGSKGNTAYTGGAFQNGSAGFTYRSSKILKVQTNTTTTPVSLKVDGNYEYVLVSTSESFPTGSNTRIYQLNNGIATNVFLENNNFVAFGGNKTTTPGGVTLNVELWLKADAPGSEMDDQEDMEKWEDQSWQFRDFVQNGTETVPQYLNKGMNFNPTVSFQFGTGSENTNRKLVSAENFPVETAKSYYSFWVSKNDGTTESSVFSYAGSSTDANRSFDGWANATNAGFRTQNTAYAHTTAPSKNYGIATAIRPQTSAQFIYQDGASTTHATRAMVASTAKAVIGNSNLTTGLPFYGAVSEIIVLSAPTAGTLISSTDLAKVHSYLAIKYGVTLDNTTYVLSNGTPAYSTTNTGYLNNIFGIARDDASGLHVKQSQSLDDATITLYVGSLAGLNSQNTSSLSPDSYMMMGSNGATGTGAYIYPSGTTFNGVPTTVALSYRSNNILKVQTNMTTSVNLKVGGRYEYVLVSTDQNFPAGPATRIYKLNDGIATGITLTTGELIAFAGAAFGATPGGVTQNVELWLSADKAQAALPVDGADIANWNDLSGNGLNFVKNNNATVANNAVPLFNYNGMNFNPAINFSEQEGQSAATNQGRKLVSEMDFPVVTSKSYYSFWVTKNDGTSTSSVFSYAGSVTDANKSFDGWADGTHLRFTTAGTAAGVTTTNHQGLSPLKSYGIGAAIRPNAGSPRALYHDGLLGTSTYTTARPMTASTVKAVIGNSDLTNGLPFYGDISEIIVLSAPTAGTPLSAPDLAKVHSYLAIKYGITLAAAAGDYVLSNGNGAPIVAFDRTTAKNTGYMNNIFGLARNDESGLHVKQAQSVEDPSISVYLGALTGLNAQNASSLPADKSYMMFGSNGATLTSNYVHYAANNENYMNNVSIDEDLNAKTNNILKVQTNMASTPVNIKAAGRYVLVSATDITFAPNNTRIYKIIDGVAVGVILNDGDLVAIASLQTAPGGVFEGMRLWLKADDIDKIGFQPSSVVNIDEWRDETDFANNYTFAAVSRTGKVRPTYLECEKRMNYHPTVSFANEAYLGIVKGPMSTDAPDDFTSFVVYRSIGYTGNGDRLYTHGFGGTNPNTGITRHPAMGFAPGNTTNNFRGAGRLYIEGDNQTNYYNGTIAGYKGNQTALHMIHTHKNTGTSTATRNGIIEHDFGGWKDILNPVANSFFGQTDAAGTGGFSMAHGGLIGGSSIAGTGTASGSFMGIISEVFFYEHELTSEQQDKVRTYLAMKYGITIDKDFDNDNPGYNADYLLSDSTVVWAGNQPAPLPNWKFHHNVVGLVRDDGADLFINKATSTGAGSIVTMTVPGHVVCGQGDHSELVNNFSGLYWGSDGKTGRIPMGVHSCGQMEERLERLWLVDKTNLSEQEVTIQVEQDDDGYFPEGNAGYELYLMVSTNETDLRNNVWQQLVPLTYINGAHEGTFTFKAKYTYFTIGYKQLPGACGTCDFLAQSLKFNNWQPRNGTNHTFNLDDGFIVNASATLGSGAAFLINYPRAGAQNSLMEYRRLQLAPQMITHVKLSSSTSKDGKSPAATSFQVFEIDCKGNRFDKVEIVGYCSGNEVNPRLSYVRTAARSSYTITGRTATAKRTPTAGGYAGQSGRMYVDFRSTVDSIQIRQWGTGVTSGSQILGIGPMDFLCPQPLPPPNEDGLIFTKQGSVKVLLCEEVLYTFQIINTNCNPFPVNFHDKLPQGMTWVSNSFSVDFESAVGPSTTVNEYAGTDSIGITSLIVPAGSTLTVRARAVFNMNATAGFYDNQAVLKYTSPIYSTQATLPSCDRLRPGCVPTTTEAVAVSNRPYPVTFDTLYSNQSCYKENGIITVTAKITNPNAFNMPDVELFAGFNEEFTYVSGSFACATITGSAFLTNLDTSEPGTIYTEGFSVPNGTHTITFKVKAPALKTNLVEATDENGLPFDPPEFVPLDIDFMMSSSSSDECLSAVWANINGSLALPYCLSKDCVISNKMITSKLLR